MCSEGTWGSRRVDDPSSKTSQAETRAMSVAFTFYHIVWWNLWTEFLEPEEFLFPCYRLGFHGTQISYFDKSPKVMESLPAIIITDILLLQLNTYTRTDRAVQKVLTMINWRSHYFPINQGNSYQHCLEKWPQIILVDFTEKVLCFDFTKVQ